MLVKNIKTASKKKPTATAKGKKTGAKKQQITIKMIMGDMEEDDFEQQMLKQIQQENRRKQLQRLEKQDKLLKKCQPQKLQVLEIEDMGEFERELKIKQEEGKLKEIQKEKKHQQRHKLTETVIVNEAIKVSNDLLEVGNSELQESHHLNHLNTDHQQKGNQSDGKEQIEQNLTNIPTIPESQLRTDTNFVTHQVDRLKDQIENVRSNMIQAQKEGVKEVEQQVEEVHNANEQQVVDFQHQQNQQSICQQDVKQAIQLRDMSYQQSELLPQNVVQQIYQQHHSHAKDVLNEKQQIGMEVMIVKESQPQEQQKQEQEMLHDKRQQQIKWQYQQPKQQQEPQQQKQQYQYQQQQEKQEQQQQEEKQQQQPQPQLQTQLNQQQPIHEQQQQQQMQQQEEIQQQSFIPIQTINKSTKAFTTTIKQGKKNKDKKKKHSATSNNKKSLNKTNLSLFTSQLEQQLMGEQHSSITNKMEQSITNIVEQSIRDGMEQQKEYQQPQGQKEQIDKLHHYSDDTELLPSTQQEHQFNLIINTKDQGNEDTINQQQYSIETTNKEVLQQQIKVVDQVKQQYHPEHQQQPQQSRLDWIQSQQQKRQEINQQELNQPKQSISLQQKQQAQSQNYQHTNLNTNISIISTQNTNKKPSTINKSKSVALKKKKQSQTKATVKQPKSLILSTITESDDFMINEEHHQQIVAKRQQQLWQQQRKQEQLNQQKHQFKQQQGQQSQLNNLSYKEVEPYNEYKQQEKEEENADKSGVIEKRQKYQDTFSQSVVVDNLQPIDNSSLLSQPTYHLQHSIMIKQQQKPFQEQQQIISISKPSSSQTFKKKKKPIIANNNSKSKQSLSSSSTINKKAKTVSLFLLETTTDVNIINEKSVKEEQQLQLSFLQQSKQGIKETPQQPVNNQPQTPQSIKIEETNNIAQLSEIQRQQPQQQTNQQQQLPPTQSSYLQQQQQNDQPYKQNSNIEQPLFQLSNQQKHQQLLEQKDVLCPNRVKQEDDQIMEFTLSTINNKSKSITSIISTNKKAPSKKTTKKSSKTTSTILKPVTKQQQKYQSLVMMETEDMFMQQQQSKITEPQEQQQQRQQQQISHITSIPQPQQQIVPEIITKRQQQQSVVKQHQNSKQDIHHDINGSIQQDLSKLQTQQKYSPSFSDSVGSQQKRSASSNENVTKEKHQQQVPQQIQHYHHNQLVLQNNQQDDQQILVQRFVPIMAVNKKKKKKTNSITNSTKKQISKKSTTTKTSVTKSLILPQLQRFDDTKNENQKVQQQEKNVEQKQNKQQVNSYHQTLNPTLVEQQSQIVAQQSKEQVDECKLQVLVKQQEQVEKVIQVHKDIVERNGQCQQLKSQTLKDEIVTQSQLAKQQQLLAQLNEPIQQISFIPTQKISKLTTAKKSIKSTINKSQSSSLSAANKLTTTAKHSTKSTGKSIIMNFITIEENPINIELSSENKKESQKEDYNQIKKIAVEKESNDLTGEIGSKSIDEQIITNQQIINIQDSSQQYALSQLSSPKNEKVNTIQLSQSSQSYSLISSILQSQLDLVKLNNQANLLSISKKVNAIKQLLAEKIKKKHQRAIEIATTSTCNKPIMDDDELNSASQYVLNQHIGLKRIIEQQTLSRTQA